MEISPDLRICIINHGCMLGPPYSVVTAANVQQNMVTIKTCFPGTLTGFEL